MSSQREVLIRILALLQRKRLIETKNRTLKCLKWHYLTVRTMKNVAVLTGDGALFLSPPRGIWQLKSPHPREFAIQGKKNAYAPGGGGAGGIDWFITLLYTIFDRKSTPFAYLLLTNFTTFTYLTVEIWRIRHKTRTFPPRFLHFFTVIKYIL